MHPAPAPEDLVDQDRRRLTLTVPDDLAEHVDPCDALLTRGPDGLAQISVRIVLDDGDARRIRQTGEVWLTFLGNVTPFSVSTEPPGGA